jgi:hypothetical protein
MSTVNGAVRKSPASASRRLSFSFIYYPLWVRFGWMEHFPAGTHAILCGRLIYHIRSALIKAVHCEFFLRSAPRVIKHPRWHLQKKLHTPGFTRFDWLRAGLCPLALSLYWHRHRRHRQSKAIKLVVGLLAAAGLRKRTPKILMSLPSLMIPRGSPCGYLPRQGCTSRACIETCLSQ